MFRPTCISGPYIMWTSEFLIGFEVWAKLAQQWLVCAPLGSVCAIEPINKELMLLVIIYHWPKERTVLWKMRSSLGQWCAMWAYQKHWCTCNYYKPDGTIHTCTCTCICNNVHVNVYTSYYQERKKERHLRQWKNENWELPVHVHVHIFFRVLPS